jgi:glycopeptide antibiotics resistance protein
MALSTMPLAWVIPFLFLETKKMFLSGTTIPAGILLLIFFEKGLRSLRHRHSFFWGYATPEMKYAEI